VKLPAPDPSLAAYITVTALLVVTPGSSTAMVIRHALSGGRAAGLATAGGIALANASWAAAAGLGITAVLARAPLVFTAIRFGGAAYLAYLGLRALTGAFRPGAKTLSSDQGEETKVSADLSSAFRDGIAVNLLNPPIATFYLVVVPSFMPAPSVGRFALLASIHVTMALVCHAVWAFGFDALRIIWTRPAARRGVDAAVGIALLALAVRMLR
jgi:threonine/homoserine/homoserine lactone efflux protein